MTHRGPEHPLPRAEPADEGDGLDLREYLQVLLRFKWGILSVTFLAGLLGLYAAYKAVPIYRSAATLQIERDAGPQLGIIYGPAFKIEFYETQYQLIRSWTVAEMAAERLGLLDADHLVGAVDNPSPQGFSWRTWLPDFLRTDAPNITPDVRRNNLIAGVQGMVNVRPVEQSELASIVIEHPDADHAARVANTVANAYIDFLRDKNLSDITGNQSWFASRLEQARQDLDDAENALQDFYDRQGLIQTAQGVDALQSQALEMALTRREEARQQKLALGRLYREIQAADGEEALENITALEGRGIVRQMKNNRAQARLNVSQLSQRYGPKHPRMMEAQTELASAEQAYRDELLAVADAVVADYQRAVQAESSYDSQLASAQADIQALNRSRAELTKLQEDVKSSRALFEQLQSGEKTAGLLEGGTQSTNATVIERARPGLYPVRPDKTRLVMTWAFGGLLIGVGLAFLLNQLDNTYKGPDDVERSLHLPVLGQLPQLKVEKGAPLGPLGHFASQPRSAFSEAIRTIRTGVSLSTLDRDRGVVMVTSSVPGEGKTTLAINLAHALAQMKSTVLIDADMRRPMVHQAKDYERPHLGLSELLAGEASLEEAREETEDGLHVIPSGARPPNPLEMLSSKRFRDLVESLQQQYEMIVLDSAPALAVSDALVISQLADGVVYVVRSDATPRQAAEQGVRRLRRAEAPLVGCVLNRVSVDARGYGYGRYGRFNPYYRYRHYGYYGSYAFHEYYGEDDEERVS